MMRGGQLQRFSRWLSGLLVASLAVGAVCAQDDLLRVEPFAPRSQPGGATLFTQLPPEATGITAENPYDDPRMWNERYRELSFGAIGTGVAIGDYDNDGRPDVFIVNKVRQSRLYRNLGDWRFEDVTEVAGLAGTGAGWRAKISGWLGMSSGAGGDPGEWKQGAVFADVNNDGLLDLYLCRFAVPNLLFINQGDGTFTEEAADRGLSVADASGMAAFHDYDRDGWLDLYLQTNMLDFAASPDGQRDYLFHNRGDGTFEDVTASAGIGGLTAGHSATWWDFDEDGWPDIFVANDFATPDNLYRNNGDGTFTDVINDVVPHTPHYSMGSDLGDVNNDGSIDFLVADMAATTHEKDQRSMAGSRVRGQVNPSHPGIVPQYMRNALYVNTGTGRMLEVARLAGVEATDWTWSVRFEDLDNDGRLDLHATNGMIREFHGSDLLERIMVTEDRAAPVRIMQQSPVLAERNLVFHNRGDLRFEEVGPAWGLDQTGVSLGSAFGDLDGDGDLDLVFGNMDGPPAVLRNDSVEGNSVVVALRGRRSNRFGVGARVEIESASGVQVRQLVLARGSLSGSEAILHFGLGEDAAIQRLSILWPSGSRQALSDLPVDRRLVITEPAANTHEEAIPRDDSRKSLFVEATEASGIALTAAAADIDETSRQPWLPVRQNRRGPSLAIGDLNDDGHEDVFMGGIASQEAAAFVRSGKAGFEDYPLAGLSRDERLNDGPALIADFNGDGFNDLLQTGAGVALRSGSSEYEPLLLLGNSGGGFRRAEGAVPSVPVSAGATATADFDHDGDLDVFIGARVDPGRYPLSSASVLLRNEGGTFTDISAQAPDLAEAGMVTAALAADVDGDGWSDLLLAVEWGGVVFLRNEAENGFVNRSTEFGFAAAGTGWWRALAAGDFNGDGALDFVAGNLGLNTQYRASPEAPVVLYLIKARSRAGFRLVEAYYEGGRLYPRRTLSELASGFPFLRSKFRKNADFARATLEEIFGASRLAAATRLEATEFRSGVFLSRSAGGFAFYPLPRGAQIAPIDGFAVADFDGDGFADIVGMQNSSAPVAVVGNFDGGLGVFLRGDGRGGFTESPHAESGLVVPGDAESVGVVNLDDDGRPDLVVTRYGDTALVFRNRGTEPRPTSRETRPR